MDASENVPGPLDSPVQGRTTLTASQAELRSILPVVPSPVPWRTWTSDRGRHWASRSKPFTKEQVHAGASRTIDADTADQLQARINVQEAIAEEAQAKLDEQAETSGGAE